MLIMFTATKMKIKHVWYRTNTIVIYYTHLTKEVKTIVVSNKKIDQSGNITKQLTDMVIQEIERK